MAKTTVNTEGKTVRAQEFDPERVRDISMAVYKERLEASSGGGDGAVARELKRIGEAGLREHASFYDALTRAYMRALGVK